MTSSISGCTACQVGGPEALKAYDQAFLLRREELAAQQARFEANETARNRLENQPIPGATVGSIINISA